MARLISDILGVDRISFKRTVDHWEALSGRKSHDIGLYSDMRVKAIAAIKQLGLDPTEVLGNELYFVLQQKATDDNFWLNDFLKITSDDSVKKQLAKIAKWIEKNCKTLDVWAVKSSVLKAYIKKTPPKNLMKTLGIRSVDSMLKRIDTDAILCLCETLENTEWKAKFNQNFKKIKASDFDQKKIRIEILDAQKIERLNKTNYNRSRIILPNYQSGGVLLVPAETRFPLDTTAMLLSIVEVISDLRRHSAYFRMISVKKDFAAKYFEVAEHGIAKASSVVSEIGWNSIHRHLIGNQDFMSQIETPYISHEEFATKSATKLLRNEDPRFDFWHDLDYVFFNDKNGTPVSMNLMDIVVAASNKLPYNQSHKAYGQNKLWEELWARYLTNDDVAEEIVGKFLNL